MTKYLIPGIFLMSFIVSWSQKEPERVRGWEVVRKARVDSLEVMVGAPTDSSFTDSLVVDGLRYYYRVRACGWDGQVSAYSTPVSGLEWAILPDVQGRSESKSWTGGGKKHLLVITYPSGPWLFSWVMRDGLEKITALSLFDRNGDRVINLSDLSIMADELRRDLSLFSQFGAVYNKAAYYEYVWEGLGPLPGTEADRWLMDKLTRQSWKSSFPGP